MAVIAVIVPGAVAILVLTGLYFGRGGGPHAGAALRGMGAAVVGFLCVTTARIGRGVIWIGALTFLSVGILRLNTFLVVLLVGGLSLCLNRPGRSKQPRPETGGLP